MVNELYDKFIENGRKPQTAFFEYNCDKNKVRCGLYRIRKLKNETFAVIQRFNKLIISDRLFEI